ncbi:MAG TPA: hypothetical protein VGJ71_06885 [Candidatus Limnocylindrales bacterium]
MSRRVAMLATVVALVPGLLAPVNVAAATSVDVALVGTFTDPSGVTGGVGGLLSIQQFADDGGLVARGTATYSLCIPGVDPKNCLATITQAVQLPIDSLTATCAAATIELGGLVLVSPPSLDGFTLRFDPASITLTADTPAAERAACSLARQLDHDARARMLARLLNRLLGALAG